MNQENPNHAQNVDWGKRSATGVALLVLALMVQLALLWVSMPLDALFSGGWHFYIDNPYHIYQLDLGRALQSDGRWVGYDPFFGAGQLAGLSTNVSARLDLLFAGLLPKSLPTSSVYAIYVLVCSLVPPLSIWGLGRVLHWTGRHIFIALVIGLLLWWVGVFRWYHTAGMVSFVCASYLAPLYAVWTYSLCDPSNPFQPRKVFFAGLAGGVGMWLHPLFCIPVAFLFLAFVLQRMRRVPPWSFIGRASLIALTVIIVCSPWLVALIQADPLINGEQPYQKVVGMKVIYNSMGFGAGGQTGAWINLLLVIICLIGVWLGRSSKQWGKQPFLLAGIGLLLFSAFAGSVSTFAYVQPNRFIGPAYLLIGMAAAAFIADWERQRSVRDHGARTIGVLILGALIAIYFGREIFREITPGPHGRHGKAPPEISAPPPEVAHLENWIKTNTSPDGRILFETSLGRVHGGGHVAGYLAKTTQREFMGGAYPYFLSQMSCWDKTCFGRPLSTVTPDFFRRAIVTYNVGWIIAHSSELKRFLHGMHGIKMVDDFDGVSIFQVEGSRSFVQVGNGRVVSRDYNRIEFSGVSGPILILRYNWAPGLVTVPRSRIEPYMWSADFPPLVQITNPPDHFRLGITNK